MLVTFLVCFLRHLTKQNDVFNRNHLCTRKKSIVDHLQCNYKPLYKINFLCLCTGFEMGRLYGGFLYLPGTIYETRINH